MTFATPSKLKVASYSLNFVPTVIDFAADGKVCTALTVFNNSGSGTIFIYVDDNSDPLPLTATSDGLAQFNLADMGCQISSVTLVNSVYEQANTDVTIVWAEQVA